MVLLFSPARAWGLSGRLCVAATLLALPPGWTASQVFSSPVVQQTNSGASSALAERQRGITLYNQGDTKAAVVVLQSFVEQQKDDAEGWHYLGLALNRENQIKGAQKAFETAVKLRPDFIAARTDLACLLLRSNKLADAIKEAGLALTLTSEDDVAHYVIAAARLRMGEDAKALSEAELSLQANADFAPALIVKSHALLGLYLDELPLSAKEARASSGTRIREARDTLAKYLTLEPNGPDADLWREQLQTLSAFSGSEADTLRWGDVTTKARVINKPEPTFTEEARRAGVNGTVVLRAVFAADGEVRHILVVRDLPYGLTQAAIQAASQIKFIPATKDGRPVSMYIRLEYNFSTF